MTIPTVPFSSTMKQPPTIIVTKDTDRMYSTLEHHSIDVCCTIREMLT